MADPSGSDYQRYLYENGWVAKDGTLNEDGEVPEFGTGKNSQKSAPWSVYMVKVLYNDNVVHVSVIEFSECI